jgi:effector-binding domain-containing protein
MRRLGYWAVFALALFAASVPGGAAFAQTPVPTESIDPFGLEVQVPAKTIVYVTGAANWDTAFDTLVESFNTVHAFLDKAGVKPAGPPMTIYTSSDDTGFEFQAAIPIAEAPKIPVEGDIAIGTSPASRSLKFVHRGAYECAISTYDAITHFLDEKMLEAQEWYVEEYVTDPATTPEEKLVFNILVPLMKAGDSSPKP